MQDLFAQDQISGEALRHLPKSSWMPIPHPAGFSLLWALHSEDPDEVGAQLLGLPVSVLALGEKSWRKG